MIFHGISTRPRPASSSWYRPSSHPVIKSNEPERCVDALMDSLTRLGRPLSDLPRLGIVEYSEAVEAGAFVRLACGCDALPVFTGDAGVLDSYVSRVLAGVSDAEGDDE